MTEKVFRDFQIDIEARAANADARTAPITLSTTFPVPRDWGTEVLDHSPQAVDLSRAPLPLLESHNSGALPVGVVENLHLDGEKLRGQIRLSKSERAGDIWQDIQDRILRGVSVGYQIFKKRDEPDGIVRITHWQPIEASLVSIPADPRSGIYRNHHQETTMEPTNSQNTRSDHVQDPDAAERAHVERDRVQGILAIGDKFKQQDAARAFLSEGKSVGSFRKFVLDKISDEQPARPLRASLDITQRERRPYSLRNAILAQLPKSMIEGRQIDAGYELELSQETARTQKRQPRGFLVPLEAFGTREGGRRDLTEGIGSAGGDLVETQLLASDFIQLLRNRTQVLRLGARTLTGLVGNVAIPAQTGAATAQWVAENANLTESDQTFSQITMQPHTVGALTQMSRRLLLQATPGIEDLVRADLVAQIAIAIDAAAIDGAGGTSPTGILATSGVGSVALGTNGGAPTYGSIVSLYQALGQANADRGALGFLANAAGKATLLTTPKIGSTYPTFIWETPDDTEANPLDGLMIGYKCGVSNNVPSNLTKGTGTNLSALIFGNWTDLYIGIWGGLDVLVDPYTLSAAGELRIVCFESVDIGIRHPASFAAIVDMITT